MSLLEEKNPGPSLAMIATLIAVITAIGFGGLWAVNNTSNANATQHHAVSSAPQSPES